MFTVQVRVEGPATETVRSVFAQVTDKRRLLVVLGRAGITLLRTHFNRLENINPNKMGGERTHFWHKVAESVSLAPEVFGDRARITVNDPRIAFKVSGGDIVPKAKQWLTLPSVADAYGMTAHEYEEESGRNLVFIKKNVETAFLAVVDVHRTEFDDENAPRKGNKVERKLEIIFVLKKRVTQKPFQGALPSEANWKAALDQTAADYLHTLLR